MLTINGVEILAIFRYGSSVYNTSNQKDVDLIIVLDSDIDTYQQKYNKVIEYDVTFYAKEEFERLLYNHHITALECYFLPSQHILYINQEWYNKLNFSLDLGKLRASISATASNSFVKCKKKLTVDRDYNLYTGKKSLFHSIRILDFGIQIAKFGSIMDYSKSNVHLDIIMNLGNEWVALKEIYKPIYNTYSTEFKKVAPLERN